MKTTLSQRLKSLDGQYFDIIAKNADDIARLEKISIPSELEPKRDFDYFRELQIRGIIILITKQMQKMF